MPTYIWSQADKTQPIEQGLKHNLVNVHVIQKPDADGGYNVEFKIEKTSYSYHVHFQMGSGKVNVVRFKGDNPAGDINITRYNSDAKGGDGPHRRENLEGLAKHLEGKFPNQFPNHVRLLRKMKEAWDDAGRPGAPENPDEEITRYKVSTFTGDVEGAGTNADVYLTIHGSSGKTRKIELANDDDNFEQGQMDVFPITEKNVHNVNKIIIGHNNSGEHSGWFLGKVIIENQKSQKKWKCECNRWLSKTEGDGEIERTLNCEEV